MYAQVLTIFFHLWDKVSLFRQIQGVLLPSCPKCCDHRCSCHPLLCSGSLPKWRGCLPLFFLLLNSSDSSDTLQSDSLWHVSFENMSHLAHTHTHMHILMHAHNQTRIIHYFSLLWIIFAMGYPFYFTVFAWVVSTLGIKPRESCSNQCCTDFFSLCFLIVVLVSHCELDL